jgi:disulfide bond formation protein DsbB
MLIPRTRVAAILCALAAALALGIALATERYGGVVPCALCLVERWPYRIGIGLGVVAFVLPVRAARIALVLAALVFLAGAGLGALHVGVEQGYWPSPLPECAAPHVSGGSIAERLASMPLRPSKPCDAPTYLIARLPLSMAAMNLLYALALSAALTLFLLRRPRENASSSVGAVR